MQVQNKDAHTRWVTWRKGQHFCLILATGRGKHHNTQTAPSTSLASGPQQHDKEGCYSTCITNKPQGLGVSSPCCPCQASSITLTCFFHLTSALSFLPTTTTKSILCIRYGSDRNYPALRCIPLPGGKGLPCFPIPWRNLFRHISQ